MTKTPDIIEVRETVIGKEVTVCFGKQRKRPHTFNVMKKSMYDKYGKLELFLKKKK